MKKIISLVIVLALSLSLLVSCSFSVETESTYDFEEGLSILLPDGLKDYDNDNFTIGKQSNKILFTALKEMKSDLTAVSSLDEYVSLIMEVNKMDSSKLKEINGTPYFTYTATTDQEYFYMTAIVEGSDAFWLCGFACVVDDAEEMEPKFLEYVESIQVK